MSAETHAGPILDEAAAEQGSDGGWLPTRRQLVEALRLRIARAAGPDPEGGPFLRGVHTSMRQGIGLVALAGLIIGLPGSVMLWVDLASAGTVLPLLRAQQATAALARWFPAGESWALASQQIGGMAPRAPAWAAAGLSALGAWLQLPLRLLAVWLVYGLLVLAVAKVLGAGTTLPRFYAVTSYAVLLLFPAILFPLPWIGTVAAAAAVVLALAAYALAVSSATLLDLGRSILCMLLPGVLLAALYAIFSLLLAGLFFM